MLNRSHGVMVSTLDFESSDPSSNLGGTYLTYYSPCLDMICTYTKLNVLVFTFTYQNAQNLSNPSF